jgi:hypothetical protein
LDVVLHEIHASNTTSADILNIAFIFLSFVQLL